jgi:hypothetical protein
MSARLVPVVTGPSQRRRALWQILLVNCGRVRDAEWCAVGFRWRRWRCTSRAFAQEDDGDAADGIVAVSDAEVGAIIEVVNPPSYEVVVLRDPFDPVVPEPEPEPEPAPPATPPATTPPGNDASRNDTSRNDTSSYDPSSYDPSGDHPSGDHPRLYGYAGDRL